MTTNRSKIEDRPYLIAIAGPSGSGKTTVATELAEHYKKQKKECLVISSDSYYVSQKDWTPEEKANANFDDPKNIDFDLLVKHLEELKHNRAVEIPSYSFLTQLRSQGPRVEPKSIIIVEGILVLYPEKLQQLFDFKVYVQTDLDICFIRRMLRDERERNLSYRATVDQYLATVKPMFHQYVAPTIEKANFVLQNPQHAVGKNIEGLLRALSRANQEHSPHLPLTHTTQFSLSPMMAALQAPTLPADFKYSQQRT